MEEESNGGRTPMLMQTPDSSPINRLENKVTLIIHGLSDSGRTLALLLAQRGSDVAIVDECLDVALAREIKQGVASCGRGCLILTPETLAATGPSFPQKALQAILSTFGRLDLFVSYTRKPAAVHPIPHVRTGLEHDRASKGNGYGMTLPRPQLIESAHLVQVALEQILHEVQQE